MDRQTTPNSSGFVYFNTSTNQEYPNNSDTSDFLAFSDSPQASPPTSKFKPHYYSSPQKFHRGSPRQYPQNNRRYQRWSGGYNRSYNSSHNSSGSFRESDQEGTNILKFIHPSFLEDPWAPLEAKLKEKAENNSEFNDSSGSVSQEA
ncbi:uncharacterized protein LOC123013929 [Tribolium madens]|uniref:uncharacterized protein LOC123013929 n=1 Tax=Tribolium madens TaxID=41895 RepID=UPI001CF73F55|nr:uncharacterized protein LOC123013929 [Tribolium madens]